MKKLFYLIVLSLFTITNLYGKDYVLTVDSPTVAENSDILNLNVRVEPKLGPNTVITFDYETQEIIGSATPGSDYVTVTSTNKVINSSFNTPSSTIITVPITILDDGESGEGDERFNVNITSVSINTSPSDAVTANSTGGVITILDNDVGTLPTLTINDRTVTENAGTATFTVLLSDTTSEDVNFAYATVDGTATGGLDYTIKSNSLMTIPASSLSTNISIPIINDIEAGEGDETFSIYLNNVNNAVIADNEGVGTIQDDDSGLTASINDASIAEGDVDKTVIVKVKFSEPIATDMNFTYTTTDGSAIDTLDYTGVNSGIASVPAGVTEHNLTLTILGDTSPESPEDFAITISNFTIDGLTVAREEGKVTIFDNDSVSSCSSYIGLMTINEYQNNPHYFDVNHQKIIGNYVEIKYIDFLVKQFVTDDWKVQIYTTAGEQGILWRDKDPECIDPRYEVFQFDNNVMGAKGYVVLTDQNGNEVDVLNIDNSNHYPQSCHNFPYDTDFESSAQNKDLFRIPDGTGTWYDTGQGANSLGSRCQGYDSETTSLQYTEFEAIDTDETLPGSYYSSGEPNDILIGKDTPIKTKIVNDAFDLKILWLNLSATPTVLKTGSSVDLNVSLGYIANGALYQLPGINPEKTVTVGTNGTIDVTGFIYDKAVPEAVVYFEYCADENQTLYNLAKCAESDNDTYVIAPPGASRNRFAIRPNNFESNITNGDIFIAEMDTELSFQALDNISAPTYDYNETQNNSFVIDLNVTGDCAINNLSITPSVSFQNGEHNDTFTFNDVGDVNMSIHEINNDYTLNDLNNPVYYLSRQEYAKVDIYDTPDTLRLIDPDDKNFTVLPDHFNVSGNFSDHHVSTDQNFTYLSDFAKNATRNAKAMASEYNLTITAEKDDNNTAENYTSGCFAKDVNITLTYSTLNAHVASVRNLTGTDLSEVQYYERNIDTGDTYYNVPIGTDINYTFSPAIFDEDINGTAQVQIDINLDRNYFTSIDPFIFRLDNIELIDTDLVDGNVSIDQNVTYFSARAKSNKDFYDDITTSSVSTPISVVVYCSLGLTNCSAYGIDTQTDEYVWYLSDNHNTNSLFDDGNITLIATGINGAAIVNPTDPNIVPMVSGINSTVSVTNTSGIVPNTVNITFADNTNGSPTNNWLIYNPYADSVPNLFYKVRFIGISDWAGHGDTGHVVDSNTSTKKNRRLGW